MRKRTMILILVAVVSVACLLVRDIALKSIISSVASNMIGAPVRINGFSLSVIKQTVAITGFTINNPGGFPRGALIHIPKVYAACDLGEIFKGKLHLKRIDFDLQEAVLVKNTEGKLNVDSLKIVQDLRAGGKQQAMMPMQIDEANLKIGRIVHKDYNVKGPVVIKVYDVNLERSYKNITSVQQLTVLLVSEPLKAAGIQGLKVYGVAAVAGVAVLPAVAVLTVTGQDYARASFDVTTEKAYAAGLKVLQEMGTVKAENKAEGVISAAVNGASVNFKMQRLAPKTLQVTISARKFGFPRPATASGVMYRVTEELGH
jgi:hypothetical protein